MSTHNVTQNNAVGRQKKHDHWVQGCKQGQSLAQPPCSTLAAGAGSMANRSALQPLGPCGNRRSREWGLWGGGRKEEGGE
jgi:hypothetical protein